MNNGATLLLLLLTTWTVKGELKGQYHGKRDGVNKYYSVSARGMNNGTTLHSFSSPPGQLQVS